MYKILLKLKSSNLFKDSFWSLIGNILGRGLSLVAGIIVARFLGKDVFGEYGIIKTTLIYLEIFSTFGLGYTATRYIANIERGNTQRIHDVIKLTYKITSITSGLISILLFVFADYIAVILDAKQIVTPLRISSLGVFFNAINVAQIGILSGLKRFKAIAINTSISGIINFIFTVLLTYYLSLDGAILALTLSFVCQCIFNKRSISKTIDTSVLFKQKVISKELQLDMLQYSLPIALQESLFAITNWAISFMLIKLSGYGELGLYSAAGQWAAIIGFIPSILRNVTLAHLSSCNQLDSRNRTIKIMVIANGACTMTIAVVLILASNLICSFYGSNFMGLKSVFIVSIITPIVVSISNVYVQDYMAIGRNWFVFICKSARDIIILISSMALITKYHTEGAITLASSTLVITSVYTLVLLLAHSHYNKKL